MSRSSSSAFALLALLLLTSPPARAGYSVDEAETLTVNADLRLRAEHDWDGARADGSVLTDRTRLRLRARLGVTFQPEAWIALGARLRTGSTASQQSPHITFKDFDDNPTGDHDVVPDRLYLRIENQEASVWVGRNDSPFWRQDELLWDADVPLTGLSVGYELTPELSLRGGWFKLPDGGIDLHGDLAAGQAVLRRTPSANFKLTFAAGLFAIRGEPGLTRLRNGNGARDYTIWSASVRTECDLGGHALALGLDGMHNSQSYGADDPDRYAAANRDEVNGFALVASYGTARELWDWQFGYSYAYVETLAVNASYAQDDWVRWGSATQTDASDFKGHELKAALGLGHGLDAVARWYMVDSIAGDGRGNRLRFDLNWSL